MQSGDYSKMKLLSLFSGIGAFEKALDNLGVKYELVNYCEIDKYASKSYAAIHNVSEDLNLGDITKVDTSKLPQDIDFVSYGFPCQDISSAGKQKGFTDENGNTTRSGLFFEALRIIQDTKPKIAIAENVKALVGNKFKQEFKIVLESLENAGYNNYYKVLNSKDYGVPQHRDRVFIVSIRKDIDPFGLLNEFQFPEPFKLNVRLRDILENDVDEKYYLSDNMINYISCQGTQNYKNADCKINLEIARPLTTDQNKRAGTTNYICDELPDNYDLKEQRNSYKLTEIEGQSALIQPVDRDYNKHNKTVKFNLNLKNDDCSHALRTSQIPYTCVKSKEQKSDNVPLKSKNKRLKSLVDKTDFKEDETLFLDTYNQLTKDIAGTITTEVDFRNSTFVYNKFRIRKLTPKECYRLMGFSDEDYEKASKINSNTQLYKQAGNSIVVDVLYYLFKSIFEQVPYFKEVL